MSQDHLELMFSSIRTQGKSCNNPTVGQFKIIDEKTTDEKLGSYN